MSQTARNKLQELINNGRENAQEALQRVQESQPKDYLAPTTEIVYSHAPVAERVQMGFPFKGDQVGFNLHRHAMQQCTEKVGLQRKFVDTLSSTNWGRDLLVHNLNTLYGHRDASRHLIRTVGGEVRGFLSDKYRRLDTPLCVEAFIESVQKFNAVPTWSRCMDTKFAIQVGLTDIVEPFPGEPMIVGMAMSNSDFGDGAFSLRQVFIRLTCLNGMTGTEALRKVHLGSRIPDDVEASDETHRLDNEALASLTRDVVEAQFKPEKVKENLDRLKACSEEKVNLKEALEELRKNSKINKSEMDKIVEVFNMGGVEELPPGNTKWRFSNAISWFAKSDDVDDHRRLELESLAGEVAGLN